MDIVYCVFTSRATSPQASIQASVFFFVGFMLSHSIFTSSA
jgi:hypothetical protein